MTQEHERPLASMISSGELRVKLRTPQKAIHWTISGNVAGIERKSLVALLINHVRNIRIYWPTRSDKTMIVPDNIEVKIGKSEYVQVESKSGINEWFSRGYVENESWVTPRK
jgi:hypothetical protein